MLENGYELSLAPEKVPDPCGAIAAEILKCCGLPVGSAGPLLKNFANLFKRTLSGETSLTRICIMLETVWATTG